MNENTPDTRFDRHAARQQRRALRGSGGWIGGVILILIGLLMFGQNLKILPFTNWWALFILLPAVGSFGTAWRLSQSAGRLTVHSRSAAIVGIACTLVAAIFLFNLNWTILGPGLLVLAGISLFINALLPE